MNYSRFPSMKRAHKILALALGASFVVSTWVASANGPRVVTLQVTGKGFEPSPVKVKKGEPLKLRVKRTTERTCAKELLIEGTSVNVPLPLNQEVEILYTPTRTGQVKYGCAMNKMIFGILQVE